MSPLASHFSQHGHIVLRSVLETNLTMLLYAYTLQLVNTYKWTSDTQVPNSPAFYAEPRIEELLLTLLPRIEEASGLRLHPTYSYLRVYQRGAVLAKHLDRPACEISVSLNLGYEAETPWPLWIEGPAGVASVQMEAGDALLYRGAECFHWRDAFSGERAAQALLHYVDQNGANAEWKFDKRRGFAFSDYPH
jgi:hypothetical protein